MAFVSSTSQMTHAAPPVMPVALSYLCVRGKRVSIFFKVLTRLFIWKILVKDDRELIESADHWCSAVSRCVNRLCHFGSLLHARIEEMLYAGQICVDNGKGITLAYGVLIGSPDSLGLTSEWAELEVVFTTLWWGGSEGVAVSRVDFSGVYSGITGSVKTREGDRSGIRRSKNIVSSTARGED